MILYAPAKVNLYLGVLGRRPDGYHTIETVFERIALFDKITLRSRTAGNGAVAQGKDDPIKIVSDHSDVPTGRSSLVYRTVEYFMRRFGISGSVDIRIFKRIPIAAGLGGGSSDAACILTGLDKLWGLSLEKERLVELGKMLGSDVPFFVYNSSFAAATGKGDEITPLDWSARLWHLVISLPAQSLSKDVYGIFAKESSSDLTREPRINKILPPDSRTVDVNTVKRMQKNDLEQIVLRREPAVARLKNTLQNIGAGCSFVSGSGPSVVSVFSKRKEAIRVQELLIRHYPAVERKGWQMFVVPTL
jgi:4-diphosphocytidyl-2-C-methyl-D-erythritol kinase